MLAASSKSMIIKPEWSETKFWFPSEVKRSSGFQYHDSERAAEIWPSMTKLNWVVNKQQIHSN